MLPSSASSLDPNPIPTPAIHYDGRESRHLFKFLTPSKIAFVILIHIYCTGSIKTMYNAALFTFLLREIEHPTEFRTLESLKTSLNSIAFTVMGGSIYRKLLDLAWTLESFDDFHKFLVSSSDYVTPRNTPPEQIKYRRPLLTTSFLGRFVRRCRLEYVKSDFDTAVFLWNAFKGFRASTAKARGIPFEVFDTPEFKEWSASKANAADGEGPGFNVTWRDPENEFGFQIPKDSHIPTEMSSFIAREDLENMCLLEIKRLEKFESSTDGTQSETLAGILAQLPSLPVPAHLIRMRESILEGDYFSAVAHLHAYFDHCFSAQASPQDTTNFYQLALLHLAILHEKFSNYADAAWAIREAINAARENKDNSSLLFSLAWLDQFVKRAVNQEKIAISISRDESLQYLKAKAKEANLPHLLGVVTLLEAQQLIRSGGPLVLVFENILRSSHVNLLFNIPRSICPQMTFQSVIWKRLGHPNLASLYTEASLRYFSGDASLYDGMNAITVKAQQELRQGDLEVCFETLDSMKEKAEHDRHSMRTMQFFRTVAELELAVGRQNVVEAKAKLEIVKVLEDDNPDFSMHVFLAEVEVAMLVGDPEKALTMVREKSRKLDESEGDMADRLYLTLLNARLLVVLGQPARTISMLLRCVDLAEKHNIRLVYLAAVRLLAKVLNEFGQHDEAYRILNAVMPFVIEARDCLLEASSYRTLAESLMARVDHDQTRLTRIRTFLQKAQNGYGLMQDVNGEMACWEKLVILFDTSGDTPARDEAGREYLALKSSIEGNRI